VASARFRPAGKRGRAESQLCAACSSNACRCPLPSRVDIAARERGKEGEDLVRRATFFDHPSNERDRYACLVENWLGVHDSAVANDAAARFWRASSEYLGFPSDIGLDRCEVEMRCRLFRVRSCPGHLVDCITEEYPASTDGEPHGREREVSMAPEPLGHSTEFTRCDVVPVTQKNERTERDEVAEGIERWPSVLIPGCLRLEEPRSLPASETIWPYLR
jgi:hypothetical protein